MNKSFVASDGLHYSLCLSKIVCKVRALLALLILLRINIFSQKTKDERRDGKPRFKTVGKKEDSNVSVSSGCAWRQ